MKLPCNWCSEELVQSQHLMNRDGVEAGTIIGWINLIQNRYTQTFFVDKQVYTAKRSSEYFGWLFYGWKGRRSGSQYFVGSISLAKLQLDGKRTLASAASPQFLPATNPPIPMGEPNPLGNHQLHRIPFSGVSREKSKFEILWWFQFIRPLVKWNRFELFSLNQQG